MRELILDVAENDRLIGPLEETLKWGEPSYLTTASKSGTTVRIDWKPKTPNHYGIYINCKTTLVDTFRSLLPELHYEGNRAILFDVHEAMPKDEIRLIISMALRYHLDKK